MSFSQKALVVCCVLGSISAHLHNSDNTGTISAPVKLQPLQETAKEIMCILDYGSGSFLKQEQEVQLLADIKLGNQGRLSWER